MAQKHLHELLKEDQEPFILTTFLADKRSLLKRPSNLQLKKRKPISQTSDFPGKFCKNACFFSFKDSPDLRKSPLIEFHSPKKSPCRNSNAIFLHIPACTAGLLLEAALRIQKQSVSSRSKTQIRSNGFGLFGSFLKRFTHRNRKREIDDGGVNGRKKDSGESFSPEKMAVGEKEFDSQCVNTGLDFHESNFCDSPFRFVLQSNESPGVRTPEFSSPVTSPVSSPVSRDDEDNKNSDAESLKKLQVEDEEEEEKEQNSPVSVLDPPFEDDDGDYEDGEENEDIYNLDCSYAIVQKAKHQLLKKLRRFEKLAELDPKELEKILLEEGEEDDNSHNYDEEAEEEEEEDRYSDLLDKEWRIKPNDEEVDDCSSFQNLPELTKNVKRLVSDQVVIDRKEMVKRICSRLGSLEGTELEAIDEMVERDFGRELGWWNQNREEVEEMAMEIELEIFSFLVEEMQNEVYCFDSLTAIY